jgi:hypothetical protein
VADIADLRVTVEARAAERAAEVATDEDVVKRAKALESCENRATPSRNGMKEGSPLTLP